MSTPHLLVAVVGPTASGKSCLAIYLAREFQGEIVNCDSLQMYRHFDLGTAKPTPAERQGIPHHFLDILEPNEQFSAGEYMRQARAVLASVTALGHLPIVVGGTGFYLRALIEGLFAGPRRNPNLRQRLQQRVAAKGPLYLHQVLRRLDPAAASGIHPNDTPKVIRALEVCLQARRPMSELFRQGRQALEGYGVVKVGLNPSRAQLYERINQRTRSLFEQGLVEEVRSILAQGYPPTAPPFLSHGYRQALDYLEGRISLEEALYHAQTNTRQYAKRQLTWFRKEAGVQWFAGFGTDPQVQAAVSRYVSDRRASLTEAGLSAVRGLS
ncbi:MAG: tRNA (adenosine(37)-N6)-dimethylallyltransferase MiaA [Acidobacteria bacterium]|nr:tRNA (adenosine(37)-N6)-dimethylallyltransferase MiaA [Acidobacteriota bacterium]